MSSADELREIRRQLRERRDELQARVERIHAHARDPLDADSEEQAAQIGNVEVVSALEDGAVEELAAIDAALERIESGTYGTCTVCGEPVGEARLEARPDADRCVACAEAGEAG